MQLMQINNQIKNNKLNTDKKNDATPFKGAATGLVCALRTLDAKDVIGAEAIDIASMALPRTVIDGKRNINAGIETGRREFSSVTLNTVMGFFGVGAAMVVGTIGKIRQYGIKFHKIATDNDTIDYFANKWKESHDSTKDTVDEFIDNTFKEIHVLNGKEWKKAEISESNNVANEIKKLLKTSDDYKIEGKKLEKLVASFVSDLGVKKDIKLVHNGKSIETTADNLLKDAYALGRTFKQEKVLETFAKNIDENEFVKLLKKCNNRKTVLGLVSVAVIGSSVQTINRYLTKLKTGSDGFVGYSEDESNSDAPKPEKDKSLKFKLMKVGAALTMAGVGVAAIGKPSQILNKIQFKGIWPTYNQFKVMYGSTIIGRLLASSDKNELRETSTRDFLGYTNWLIFGGFVSKLVATAFEKGNLRKGMDNPLLINHVENNGNKIIKGNLKTHDEILINAFDKKTFKKLVENKFNFKEVFKKISKNDEAITKLKQLSVAHVAGFTYSCLVLGVFVPWLNKTITNDAVKKQKENAETSKTLNNNNKQSNIMFLNRERMPEQTKKLFSAFIKN